MGRRKYKDSKIAKFVAGFFIGALATILGLVFFSSQPVRISDAPAIMFIGGLLSGIFNLMI